MAHQTAQINTNAAYQPPPKRITIKQAATENNMSPHWIRQQIAAGSLPAIRLGRVFRIDRSDLDAFFESRKV